MPAARRISPELVNAAAHFLERALGLPLELCGLFFQRNDLSKGDLVSTTLFGVGAVAVLVSGAGTCVPGIRMLSGKSPRRYDSPETMGWGGDYRALNVPFCRDIPALVRSLVRLAPWDSSARRTSS